MSSINNSVGGGDLWPIQDPNPSAWSKYDRDAAVSDGVVDHGQSAVDNLKSLGSIPKDAAHLLGSALKGTNILSRFESEVRGPGHYAANLGLALVATAVVPLRVAKDLVDAAVHGVMAGFKKIF